MTTQKDFKRLVRGRMQKTGESYTAARASVLRKRPDNANGQGETGSPAAAANGTLAAAGPSPADFARIAGMSDETIKAKTGCTWEKWVWALDQVQAHKWPHREIARYVHEKYKIPGWWTQSVTVGYERIRGLREKGQRRSGSWEASRSKTIDAAIGTVFKAFKQPKRRSAWLPATVVERTSVPNKSLRFTWEDGTSVEVYLTRKERSRCIVSIQHTRLPDKASASRMKEFWVTRLGALAALLAKPAP